VLFNSFSYLVFLPLTVLVHWLLPQRFRTTLLLLASYLFYMNWIPAYAILIFALTVINYFFGLAINHFVSAKRQLLVAGLIVNLSCLCFFKYSNFLLDSLRESLSWLIQIKQEHIAQVPHMNIILPLGISFFVFEFIHYIVDVSRGSEPVKNFRDFALFAAFFPSQIAGPIKRYQDFIAQLRRPRSFDQNSFAMGIFLILQGLFKKVVLGDNMGILVEYGFSHINKLGTVDAWLAVVGFTFQIFFDFSGYTDIGRGSALLFGYSVPENFNWPFLSASLTEFWRRWHISLSTWLRDYLFIPLGGSRGQAWAVRRNIMLTMIIGGLWHGAAWHYAIWGAFHGLGLVIAKDWHELVSKIKPLASWRDNVQNNPVLHCLWHYSGVVVTLLFLFIAGTLFKAKNLNDTWDMLTKLVSATPSGELSRNFLLSTLPVSLVTYSGFLLIRWVISSSSLIQSRVGAPRLQLGAVAYSPGSTGILSGSHPGSAGFQPASRARTTRPYDESDLSDFTKSADFTGGADVPSAPRAHTMRPYGTRAILDWCNSSLPLRVISCSSVAIVILGFAPAKLAPFIYFQF
jgi:D-alanyl-lipoteichoic acid acyltransferase DltB (MBOAT superfamily)